MIAGIVCEYNPFHKGHLYQLDQTRKAGSDTIVCVMDKSTDGCALRRRCCD